MYYNMWLHLYILLVLTFRESFGNNLSSRDSRIEENNSLVYFLEDLIGEEDLEGCFFTFDWNQTSTFWSQEILRIVSHFERRDDSR